LDDRILQAVCTLALVGKLEVCRQEHKVEGKLVCKLERMELVGTQERKVEGKLVCMLEHMVLEAVGKQEHKQAC